MTYSYQIGCERLILNIQMESLVIYGFRNCANTHYQFKNGFVVVFNELIAYTGTHPPEAVATGWSLCGHLRAEGKGCGYFQGAFQ